jgi:hypothetical protein
LPIQRRDDIVNDSHLIKKGDRSMRPLIQARMEVTLPPQMCDRGVRNLWERMVNSGRLPPICGCVPFTREATVLWGELSLGRLSKGVFFITDLEKTETGFACWVSVRPNEEGIVSPIDWTKRFLLCDRIRGWLFDEDADTVTYYPDDPEMGITLSGIKQICLGEDGQ